MELNDAYTVLKGTPHADHRHPQRVPEPEEPVHPRQLRHVSVLNARELRGRPRAAVRPQLLGDQRSAPARGVQGASVGLLRGRFVAGAVEHDRDVWHPTRRADVPDQAERQSGVGRQLRLCHRRRPEPCRVVAARRHQLRPEWQGHPADSWRDRPVHGPAGVCVDFESVRQHRHRLHAHRRLLPAGERDDDANNIPFITDPLNQPTHGDRRARQARSRTRST